MKHVSVLFADGGTLDLLGDPLLDPVEKSLIISGTDGSYTAINWQFICLYTVQEHTEDDDE